MTMSWRDPRVPPPEDCVLRPLLERRATVMPDKVFARFPDGRAGRHRPVVAAQRPRRPPRLVRAQPTPVPRGETRAHRRPDGAGRSTENAMSTDAMMIDCDGHILEPPDLWETYLEPRYREPRDPHPRRRRRLRVPRDRRPARHAAPPRAARHARRDGQAGGRGARLRERAMRGEMRPEEMRGHPPGARADLPARRRVRHDGHGRARRSCSTARAWPRPSSTRRSASSGKPS